MSNDPRSSLARAQADLVRALTAQAAPPPEFDPARLALAAKMLLEKRARAVVRAWPKLAESLGSGFAEKFSAYAAAHSIPHSAGALTDGLRFIQFLYSRRQLPREACLEWLQYRAGRHCIACARLPAPGHFALCFRLPGRSRLRLIRF